MTILGRVVHHKDWKINVIAWRHYSDFQNSTEGDQDSGSSDDTLSDDVITLTPTRGDPSVLKEKRKNTYTLALGTLRKKDRKKILRVIGPENDLKKIDRIAKPRRRIRHERKPKTGDI
jgi:hypothetical protein